MGSNRIGPAVCTMVLLSACAQAAPSDHAHLSIDGHAQTVSHVSCAPRHHYVVIDALTFSWANGFGQAAYQQLGNKTASLYTGTIEVRTNPNDAYAWQFAADLREVLPGGIQGTGTIRAAGDVHCLATDNGAVRFSSPTGIQLNMPDDASQVDSFTASLDHRDCGGLHDLGFLVEANGIPVHEGIFSVSNTTKVLGAPGQRLPPASYQLDGQVSHGASGTLVIAFPGCTVRQSWILSLDP